MHSLEHEDLCLLYESGELSASERMVFERELATCDSCRLFQRALRRHSTIAKVAVCLPSEALDESIIGQIRADSRPEPVLRSNRRALALACAAALLAFAAADGSRRSLAWNIGLEREMASVGDDIEALSLGMNSDAGESPSSDFDAEINDLEKGVESLRHQAL